MNKFFCFLAVGLAFTFLQVATVSADPGPMDCALPANATTDACMNAASGGSHGDHPCSGMTGDALIQCTEENPPPSGTSAAGGPPTLTLEDPRCQLAPADRDPGCPVMAGGADHHADGAHGGMAPGTSAAGTGAGGDGVALTIDDPRCIVAPEARDHRCPGFVAP